MSTKKLTFSAILVALALSLSYFERFIPLELIVPLPGVKLGLANIVTLFAVFRLEKRYSAGILFVRCVIGSVFGGGITSLVFSLFGGYLAYFVMILAKKNRLLSVFGVSMLGAAAHNVGQVCAAMAVLGSGYVIAYLPFLLVAGVFCGFFTGFVVSGVLRVVK